MEYQSVTTERQNIFYRVYGWMSYALLITGLVAYVGAFFEPISSYIKSNFLTIFIVSFVAQLILVVVLNFYLTKLNYFFALFLFSLFSFLMGLTFTSIFYVYTSTSIITTFFISAGMFGLMALFGFYTKEDLSKLGLILHMMLLGLVIALVVNLFLRSSFLDTILACVGVLIFSGLTAVSVQKIKQLSNIMTSNIETLNKVALISALSLYLNFINLFLSLLRLLGTRRE